MVTPNSLSNCVGDDRADDTQCMQNAINAAAAAGVPLKFDVRHLYRITSTLNITSPLKIEGPQRYGIWPFNQPNAAGVQKCPWGLVTHNTGIVMINASAVTGTIRNMCIDSTGDGTVNPTAGAAIKLAPPSITTFSSGWDIQYNSFVNPYIGVDIPGNGPGAGCCGAGTASNGVVVSHNTFLSPSFAAIEYGENSAASTGGPGTVGIVVEDNSIVCKSSYSKTHAYGIVGYEGQIWYNGTSNGPERCNIGFAALPGTLGGVPQSLQITADGVFGDQSTTNDLLIKPATGGSIVTSQIGGIIPWANNTSASYTSVLIDCTAAAYCSDINWIGGFVHGGNGQNVPVFDIEGGTNGPYSVTLSGIDICQQGTPASGAVGLKLNAGTGSTGRWIVTGSKIGTGCNNGTSMPTGIQLLVSSTSASNGSVTIVGNDLSGVTTPITYTPNTSVIDHVIIHDNQGLDDRIPSVATATSVSFPGPYPTMYFTGTTTVNTLWGGFSNEKITINAVSGFTFGVSGGTGTLCGATPLALTAGNSYSFLYKGSGNGSCWSHIQ
jgi:hypothetical protein